MQLFVLFDLGEIISWNVPYAPKTNVKDFQQEVKSYFE
jgi:hypothetical protein